MATSNNPAKLRCRLFPNVDSPSRNLGNGSEFDELAIPQFTPDKLARPPARSSLDPALTAGAVLAATHVMAAVPLMSVAFGRAYVELVEGDIADQETDAIVTAAHWDLAGGQGTDGSVHFKAGPELLEACRRIGWCGVGDAVITKGYNLRARYVIHAVGPVWDRGLADEPDSLRSAYFSSLSLAVENDLRSISFPSISTGAFCYPMKLAAPIAMQAIVDFLETRPHRLELVRMVLYPRESSRARSPYQQALLRHAR